MDKIRTPYSQRDYWMSEIHYQYGKEMFGQDIDGLEVFIEKKNNKAVALAEFKQDHERISLVSMEPMIYLADAVSIPAYIVVGTRYPYVYYDLIPLNEACRKLPWMENGARYLTERQYVGFLHALRDMKPKADVLATKSNKLPQEHLRFVPKIVG